MPEMRPGTKYDAIIIGSGPNGLAAGIRLASRGLHVKIIEAKQTIGGGMRTREIMRKGVFHDICSAIHPMAVSSPYLKQLPLYNYGLEWIHPPVCAAHPVDRNHAAAIYNDLYKTAFGLGADEKKYKSIVEPITESWEELSADFLGPLQFPSHPFKMAKFGLKALQPASLFQKKFKTEKAKALFAGMAAHSMLPLNNMATAAIGLVFFGTAHTGGWPLPKGGSQQIANAMAAYFKELGGEIETGMQVKEFKQIPGCRALLFDLTPRQISKIMKDNFSPSYQKKLTRFEYGPGAFKIDYILKEPVPWLHNSCRNAGTVHLGGTFDEIADAELQVNRGKHPENPFVLVAQQSLFDDTRSQNGKHTLWAYCHVPNGSEKDMTAAIENQIERFAPGFRDIIDEKDTMNTAEFQNYNANYIGGDINGGRQNFSQMFKRPVNIRNPYATPLSGVYICSSSTPPGGGVHGMCGYHAANLALKNEFNEDSRS